MGYIRDFAKPYKFKRFKNLVIAPTKILTLKEYTKPSKRPTLNGKMIKCKALQELLLKEIKKDFILKEVYQTDEYTAIVFERAAWTNAILV